MAGADETEDAKLIQGSRKGKTLISFVVEGLENTLSTFLLDAAGNVKHSLALKDKDCLLLPCS